MCAGTIITCEDLISISLSLEMVVSKPLSNKSFPNLFALSNVFVAKIILYPLYFSRFNSSTSKSTFPLNVGTSLLSKFIIDFIEKLFIDFGNSEFNTTDLSFTKYSKSV